MQPPFFLAGAKAYWRSRVTTVYPRQKRYANDPQSAAGFPPADVFIERIEPPATQEAGNPPLRCKTCVSSKATERQQSGIQVLQFRRGNGPAGSLPVVERKEPLALDYTVSFNRDLKGSIEG